jgi:GT2 family glycosyltransferase
VILAHPVLGGVLIMSDVARSSASPPITVAVVSWNTRDLLRRNLEALKPDADGGLLEVWVVDNGSTDGSPEMVRSKHPWVTLLTPSTNLGFGPAVNLVAGQTTGPWLVAANADVAPQPGALAHLQTTAARHPRIGMIGPRLVLIDGSTQVSIQPFPGPRASLMLALHAGRFSARAARALCAPGAWEPEAATAVPWITGALVLMSRSAFQQAGGFDPDRWLYGEDLDLCWRMRTAGWEIWYEPGARVHHAHSAASSQRFEEADLDNHIDTVNFLWMMRHRGRFLTRLAACVGVIDALVRIAWLGAAARLDPARFGWRAWRARRALGQHLLGFHSEAELERRIRRSQPVE